jgi:hypothetical protein
MMRTAKVNRWQVEIAILTFLTLCLFPKCLASSDSDGQQITEQGRADAVVGRDTAFLYKITAEDSVRILPSGAIETKSHSWRS